MSHDWNDDDRLLAALGEAVGEGRRVPERHLELGRAAFTWRHIDAELAALTSDSLTGAATGTRAEPAELRTLTFSGEHLTIELELTADALLGQLVPPQPGEVELLGRDGPAVAAVADDVGWFVLRPVPTGPVRLRVRPAQGEIVITEWVLL